MGCFEDFSHFNIISDISQLESRRYPISEITVSRPRLEPGKGEECT